MTRRIFALALAAWLAPVLPAQQTFDNTGNGLLNGTYNYRQIFWDTDNSLGTASTGSLARAIALFGQVSFDGAGHFTLTGQYYDSNDVLGRVQDRPSLTGTYTLSASGYGFMTNPLANGGTVYITVSNNIILGSSTDDGSASTAPVNDVFIAAIASGVTNQSFNGTYYVSEMGFPDGRPSGTTNALMRMRPNGQGGFTGIDVSGYIGSSALITEAPPSATYTIAGGLGTLDFGTTSGRTLSIGKRRFYLSPDGNFIFGGSVDNFDLFVGVRASTSVVPSNLLKGLYYQAGARFRVASPQSLLQTYYGAENFVGSELFGHKRRLSGFNISPDDFTYTDTVNLAPDGVFDDLFSIRHYPSADGSLVIGTGVGPVLALEIAMKVPDVPAQGVFVSPMGVLNAAGSSPFTVGIAPGELVTIYGDGMAPRFEANTDFPKEIAGVSVTFNGTQAPLYYVSSSQIAAVVPFGITGNFANVQVLNNGTASNTVSLFIKNNAPGFFTLNQRGSGLAAALHADFSPLNRQSPAVPGETVLLYLSGLGAVSPTIADGDLAPVSPLSRTTNTFNASVAGITATTSFVGLAPQLRGLYQVNLQIPSSTPSGDQFVDILGPGSRNSQAVLPIGGAGRTTVVAPRVRETDPGQKYDRGEASSLPGISLSRPR